MRHVRIVGSALAALVAGACATVPSGMQGNTPLTETSPQVVSQQLDARQRDSLLAQTYADRQGPEGWIYADANAESGSRHVRADFHLSDDAYVVVGHIDADGVLRIVFPTSPNDDGFVKGDKSYLTDEFFAGFNEQYRYRARDIQLTRGLAPQVDSYDGGAGYVFMVASWRPMRFGAFSSNGIWNRFELTDDDYLRDPRPAINELASILAGDNREAYTVQYAHYYNTISSLGFMGGGFDSGYCSGFNTIGFAAFGSRYGIGGCGGGSTFGYSGYGFGLGGGIIRTIPSVPVWTPRVYAFDGHRPPPRPQPTGKLHLPTTGANGTDHSSATAPSLTEPKAPSPEYRRRGLITNDDGTTAGSADRPRRAEARVHTEDRTRPSIDQMVNPRSDAHQRTPTDAQPRPADRADRPARSAPSDHPRPEPRADQPSRVATPRAAPAPAPTPAPANPPAATTTPTPSRPRR